MTAGISEIEKNKVLEIVSHMDVEQMQVAIQAIPIQIVFNELERREGQRIELLKKLDELSVFVGGVTR